MSDLQPSPEFEDELRAVLAAPSANPVFIKTLQAKIIEQAESHSVKTKQLAFLRPVWVTIIILAFLLVGFLWIGPQRVVAGVRGLLGYIPGVGFVEQDSPMRVLAEPVSVTREGVTVTVTRAILLSDRTQLDYQVFGVPRSAYPKDEAVSGCISSAELILPDGTRLPVYENMSAIPATINEATFRLPCISNTLPGSVPENWELSIRFIPAPPDLTVMPVLDVSPSPDATVILEGSSTPQVAPETPVAVQTVLATQTIVSAPDAIITIDKVIETGDGYILVGGFIPQVSQSSWVQVTSAPEIMDANGKRVFYTMVTDMDLSNYDQVGNGAYGWAYQFKAQNLAYPLTIRFSGVTISLADPYATAEFEFDAGADPQPGQEWVINQDLTLAGHTLRITKISLDTRGGYSFFFDTDAQVDTASVNIVGYQPNGGGGGGGGSVSGQFSTSLSYAVLPKGVLKVVVSNLTVVSATQTWQSEWSPAVIRTDWPVEPTPLFPVCLTADSLAQLSPLPASMPGKALLYEQLGENGNWGFTLANLDGSQKQVIESQGNWGALSPDGSRMAFSSETGLKIIELTSSAETALNVDGYDLHWSPDGAQIAFAGAGDLVGAYVVNRDGTNLKQVATLGYEAIVGWTPDSAQIYVTIPNPNGNSWMLQMVDVTTSSAQNLFVLENASRKAPYTTVSPDGNWIAYRDSDNSSLYLVQTDGTQLHLVLEKASDAISSIVWSDGWLGVSLANSNTEQRIDIVLDPESCQTYLLPELHGDMQGLLLP